MIETLLTLLLMDAPVVPARFDWNAVAALATVALAFIGIVAALAAMRTLRAIEQQTGVLQESISVARASANAAEKSANALINIERAWVEVHLEGGHGQKPQIILGTDATGGTSVSANIAFTCTNFGKTPAWITTKQIGMIVLSNQTAAPDKIPEVHDFPFIGPELVAAGKTLEHSGMLHCEGHITVDHPGLIYLSIRDLTMEPGTHRILTGSKRTTCGNAF